MFSSLAKQLDPGDTVVLKLIATSGCAHLKLNRPQSLNALTIAQTNYIHAHLREAETKKFMLISSAGDRAFCAGGDVLSMADWSRRGSGNLEWFGIEYFLNERLARLSIPCVSLWKGVVMGGGVGLSIYGTHRIATDTTVLAMPETGIGFIPDVGASFFLPRISGGFNARKPGNGAEKFPGLGLYLALSGARVFGQDTLKFGLATHFVAVDKMAELEHNLLGLKESEHIDEILADFTAVCPSPSSPHLSSHRSHTQAKEFSDETLAGIAIYFQESNFEFFWSRLTGSIDLFAKETVELLRAKCPLTVRVAFELFQKGRRTSETVASCLDREFKVSVFLTQTDPHNFLEGVRAQLIDKGKGPKADYRPKTIEEVNDEMVQRVMLAEGVADLGLSGEVV